MWDLPLKQLFTSNYDRESLTREYIIHTNLRLGDNANIVLSINSKGLLQIIVDSGIGAYTYLLPAKN